MSQFDRDVEYDQGKFYLKNALIVFTLIFVTSGAVLLSTPTP